MVFSFIDYNYSFLVIYDDKLADSAKNSRRAMAAVSAIPPIRATAPAV